MKRVLVLMAVAAMTVACGGKKQAVQTVVEEKPITKTTPAVAMTVPQTEEYTSEIDPYNENDITPAASGVHIDRILVDVGSRVTKGQLVATLDPTQYNQARVQLQTVKDDYMRLEPVFKAGGISAQALEQAKAALDVQQEVVDNLKKNIELRSPLTGVVTARNYEPGNLFANSPILHVMQIDRLKVVANISEQFFPAVKLGMPVEVKCDLFPDESFSGKVSLIYPALDSQTRTFTVEVTVPNAKERLRPGMFVRTVFNMGDKSGIMVPDVAIQKQVGSSERYLYVVKEGVAERRAVKLGRQIDGLVDVLSGVEAGEEVAVTGLSRLSNGAEVEVK